MARASHKAGHLAVFAGPVLQCGMEQPVALGHAVSDKLRYGELQERCNLDQAEMEN